MLSYNEQYKRTFSNAVLLEYIDGGEGHAVHLQNAGGAHREAARGLRRRAFHEEHQCVRFDYRLDALSQLRVHLLLRLIRSRRSRCGLRRRFCPLRQRGRERERWRPTFEMPEQKTTGAERSI